MLILAMSMLISSPGTAQDNGEKQLYDFDRSSAVIFAYFKIGANGYPGTSLRNEQFENHVREITTQDYTPLPIGEIVDALEKGASLPEKSLAVTFDGAHRSVLQNALPLLRQHNIPFTLFIAPGRIDDKSPLFMTWADIQKIAQWPEATIGLTLNDYEHAYDLSRAELKASINNAVARYREQLDREPQYFAYPFGEHPRDLIKILKTHAFKAGFGQHSGVAGKASDVLTLPRFTMTEMYGDLQRFQLVANALPLPVSDIQPASQSLENNPPRISFTLPEKLQDRADLLRCYAAGQDSAQITRIGENRIIVEPVSAFERYRARLNCTIPAATSYNETDPRWRWHGMLFHLPEHLLGAQSSQAGDPAAKSGGTDQ